MKASKRLALACAMASLAVAGVSTPASAAITINIAQSGSNVVAQGSGTFNTAGLTFQQMYVTGAGVNSASGLIRVGDGDTYNFFSGVSGPAIGSQFGYTRASKTTGDLFGVGSFANAIYLPIGYQSSAALTGTATFANATFASLGLITGTYTFRSAVDTVTVNVLAAVPEPATWAMMLLGFGAIGFTMRRKRTPALATA